MLKKNDRLIINLLAILIILVVSIGISDLISKSYRNKAFSSNGQPTFTTASEYTREPEDVENIYKPEYVDDIYAPEYVDDIYENEESHAIYQSEKHLESIVKDLADSYKTEEINPFPRMAFIIDDLGYEKNVAEKLMTLNFPVTLSILPFLQYSKYIAEQGNLQNKEIILHLPMEAKNSSADPGPGAIKSYMSENEIKQIVKDCIDSIPYVSGMNNHMGSKITEDKRIMSYIFDEIKRIDSNLFFIDSKTSKNSIAYDLAREIGLNALERTVFLDNEDDMDYIKEQLIKAKELSLKKGQAIVIGHDRINTYYVLKRMVPEIMKEGIEIVFVSTLVNNAK